jgi:mono/diheme cytochrome c family protein
MKFPASHFTLGLIAAAALTLTACGGGSGGSDNSSTVAITTVTPTVMDGLIGKALVCWDANNNGVCDANETQGTTDSTGKATLYIPTASLASAKLIAVVTAGVSSDADTGLVTTGYTLRATAGKHVVISPLTDMTQAKIAADGTQTFETAQAAVLSELGLSSSISVTDNFIAKRDTDNNYKDAGLKAHVLVLVKQAATQDGKQLDCTSVGKQLNENLTPVLESIKSALKNDAGVQSACSSTASIGSNCEAALKTKAEAVVSSCAAPVTPVTPATPVTPSGSTAQTISFTTPATQTMGVATPALTATSTSGLAISFASTTPAVCTVSATTLTLVNAGSCSVSASQAGNTSYAAASTVVQTFTVLAATTPPVPVTSAVNGKLIYGANTCAACHGMPPSVNKIQNGANNPTRILNAINNGTGGMNMYIGKFSNQELSDIAAYLATPGI